VREGILWLTSVTVERPKSVTVCKGTLWLTWVIWVVFPDPVSPTTTTIWFSRITCGTPQAKECHRLTSHKVTDNPCYTTRARTKILQGTGWADWAVC